MESKVLAFVLESWPSSPLHVAEHFHADLSSFEAKKRASAKFAYYLQKLVDKQLLLSKRVGNALVVWPLEVEKLRALHAVLNSENTVLHSSKSFSVFEKKESKPKPVASFKGVA